MAAGRQGTRRLPAEWEPQDAVLLAWPHGNTDWASDLDAVDAVYQAVATAIGRFETVLVATPEPARVAALLRGKIPPQRLRIHNVPTQDTWARDFGPLTVYADGQPRLLDFTFNGWGGKYPADLDNAVTSSLAAQGAFGTVTREPVGMVLEGGSIDSDGAGTLLTTAACLLNPNRNPGLDAAAITAALRRQLGAERLLWLTHGALEGDDTDGHVDTLARFAPHDTILYVACPDGADAHHACLAAMRDDLAALRTAAGRPYRLLPLPWPTPRRDADGMRLPCTYANFLAINGAVLAPLYGDPRDATALETVGAAFPGREPIGIDCSALVRQHGSLHCVTMQIPKGGLA
jgi:agmatine deiminase